MDNQVGPAVAAWVICILIAWAVGSGKGQGTNGFLLGFLLGPLGILLALVVLKPSVAVQAQRDVALERAREAERERLREEGRAQARAEMGQPPASTP